MWKKKKETPTVNQGNDRESQWDDFLAGSGKKVVRAEIVLSEPPSITFELGSHKEKSKRHVTGSYFVNMCGTVEYAQKTTLEGKTCYISINRDGGAYGSETYEKGYLGWANLRMGFLDVKVDTTSDYVSDLVGLINLHGLDNSRLIRITIDLVYTKSLSLDDVESFEVVRFAVYPKTKS